MIIRINYNNKTHRINKISYWFWQDLREKTTGSFLSSVVDDTGIPFSRSIELCDPFDVEPLLEFLPNYRSQSVPKHYLHFVLGVQLRLRLQQQVPTYLSNVLGSCSLKL